MVEKGSGNLNFYEVLNVSTKATEKDIKKAYRLLAKKYHPDTYDGNKEFAEAKMQEINVAYDTLSNSDLRREYDERLGINVVKTYDTTSKSTDYTQHYYSSNRYDKSGVNYDVKYRPNNRNINYDSRGYAESNYYTYENDYDIRSDFSIKRIREVFGGKKLKFTLMFFIIVVVIVIACFYVAIQNINNFFFSTRNAYNQITSPKATNERANERAPEKYNAVENFNNVLNEPVYIDIEDSINKIKNEGKELIDQYKQQTKNKDQKETLNELGITSEEEQKAVLDFINNLKQNN